MTISTSSSSVSYQGNGATTVFAYSFLIDDAAHVVVTITDTTVSPNTVTTLSSGQYAISGIGSKTGGTVTVLTDPATGAAIAAGKYLTISRSVPYTQAVSLANQDGFYPAVVEAAIDDVVMQVQQVVDTVARAVKVPVGSGIDPSTYLSSVQTSQSAAAASATSAANSATAAAGSATTASNGAAVITANLTAINNITANLTAVQNAATNATNAAASASTATTQASAAAASASSASTAATNAGNSATAAAGSATTASTAATNASNSATSASGSASTATTQATNASNSATGAAASASTASAAATNAANSATAAAGSATSAANSATAAAASASSVAGLSGTSSTSTTIGTGSKTITTQTGLGFQVGQVVMVAYTTTPSNYMHGQVTAYNSGTGSLTVSVGDTGGSGTYAAWTISLSGTQGTAAGGSVTGPGSSTNGDVVTFNGTTGQIVQDSGIAASNLMLKTNNLSDVSNAVTALSNLGGQAALVSGTNIKTVNSTSLLGSGDVAVQPTLVSGTNIKTVNGNSLLGSGDLLVSGGGARWQTVLFGDATNGAASFLTTGSSLTPAFTATVPLTISFANGFTSSGASDLVTQLSAGAGTSSCSANTLNYIYATYASSSSVAWGATKAPFQKGFVYNQGMQSSLTLNNKSTDDFGNTWTLVGSPTYSNSSPAITSTYFLTVNGSSQYAYTDSVPTISAYGNGGWAVRIWAKCAALPGGSCGIFALGTPSTSFGGITIGLNSSGKVLFWASSNGSSWDIANGIAGTTTIGTGVWHFYEATYDPIQGKYYVYVDGTLDQTITSASRVYAASRVQIGAYWSGVSTVGGYFNGSVQGFEFLPYCQHPAGTTYSNPTALADVTAAGYAPMWFDVGARIMKKVSAASGSAGTNPTFTTANIVDVGEAAAGASTISSVVSYAFQGIYSSFNSPTTYAASTVYSFSHNIGWPVELVQTTAYARSAAHYAWMESASTQITSSYAYEATTGVTRNAAIVSTGSGGMVVNNSQTGGSVSSASAGQVALVARRRF